MVYKLERYYRYIELLLTLLLFGLALSYDSIHFPRAYMFIAGFGGFACLILARIRGLSPKTESISYLVSVLMVIFLEFQSRYIINYFIHILYILLIVELAITLRSIKELWIGLVIVGAGMYKYATLIQYKPAISTYAEALFFLLLNLMSIFIITLMQGLREERIKIMEANEKLKLYADEVRELTEIKTRADIAGKIHDGVGHNLTALIMQLEMTSHLLKNNPEMAVTHLEAAKETARDNLVQVRKAVKTLDRTYKSDSITELIKGFSNKTGVKISWEIDESLLQDFETKNCMYRAVQEAMTNAVRHGKATNIHITLKLISIGEQNSALELRVEDNGAAKAVPRPGYGLGKLMDRFSDLSGSVAFRVSDGLTLIGQVPYKTEGEKHND